MHCSDKTVCGKDAVDIVADSETIRAGLYKVVLSDLRQGCVLCGDELRFDGELDTGFKGPFGRVIEKTSVAAEKGSVRLCQGCIRRIGETLEGVTQIDWHSVRTADHVTSETVC